MAHRLGFCLFLTFLLTLLPCAWGASAPVKNSAQLIPVRFVQGTVHGFLQMRSEDGHIVASGDSVQVAHGSQVTVHSTGKDGKEEVKTDHLTLPADLANGMVPLVIEHIRSGVAETTVPMLVLTPKPRLVKLIISPRGEESFDVVGSPRKALHYEIKINIGGIEGMVAPIVGKAPPNIQLWIIGGLAPTFLREEGPIYAEGPIMTIELASPVWPDAAKPGS